MSEKCECISKKHMTGDEGNVIMTTFWELNCDLRSNLYTALCRALLNTSCLVHADKQRAFRRVVHVLIRLLFSLMSKHISK